MFVKDWLRPPRHLIAIFLVIVLLPSALLIVSGWRLMTREETLARQARQSQMADVVVAELRQRIAGVATQLADGRGGFVSASDREDFVVVIFEGDTAVATPADRLSYYPVTRAGRSIPVAAIAEAQNLRRLGQVDAAIEAWSRASRATEASVVGATLSVSDALMTEPEWCM